MWDRFAEKVRLLCRAKWHFAPPKRTKVLIYDRVWSELFQNYIDQDEIAILDVRGESVNWYVLLVSWMNLLLRRKYSSYFDNYIDIVGPELLLTCIDNSADFYLLSDKFPYLRTAFVQNGLRAYDNEVFSVLDKKNLGREKCRVDKMFVFGDNIARYYERYVRGETIPIGSFKNNEILESNGFVKGTVAFISEFRERNREREEGYRRSICGKLLSWDQIYQADMVVVKFLGQYCRRNGLKLLICGNGKMKNERELFRELLGDGDWELLPKLGTYDSYKNIDNANYVVSIDSTLGYESLARGKRTAILSVRGVFLETSDKKFGWPVEFADNGPFWTNNNDAEDFERVMDFVVQSHDAQWKEMWEQYVPGIIAYDPGNTLFLQSMRDLNLPVVQ